MIAVLDLGIGNLSSVQSGFRRAGADTVVVSRVSQWETLTTAAPSLQGVILPGVGAFGDAKFQLRASGLLTVVRNIVREGIPLLGICLGMQLLFSMSEENGSHIGLGVFPGKVMRFGNQVKVPHMGWNSLTEVRKHPLLAGIDKGDYVYFVHSYYAVLQEEESLLAGAMYGDTLVPAVVGRGNAFGAQFHPEKSGPVGERILQNFVAICNQWQAARGASARA